MGVPAALKFNAENTLEDAKGTGVRRFGLAGMFAPLASGGGVFLLCLPGEPFTDADSGQ
mgnify:CR=1 FL=1